MSGLEIARIVLVVLLLLAAGFFVFSITMYFRVYKIIQALFSKVKNNSAEYNRIRRQQLEEKLARNTEEDAEKQKLSIIDNIYLMIKRLGILEKLPGFTELHILIGYCIFLLLLCTIVTVNSSLFAGLFFVAVAIALTKIFGDFIIYQKKEKLEEQLTPFINACEGSASIYSDIIDIIGDVYERMNSPLKEQLEECYISAKTTNNRNAALNQLKKKTNSIHFWSVIDSLQLCSQITGDYRKTINDIREPIRIYQTYKKRKKSLVRNARVTILIMTVLGMGIVFAAMQFIEGLQEVIFHTGTGMVLVGIVIAILAAALSIRAD